MSTKPSTESDNKKFGYFKNKLDWCKGGSPEYKFSYHNAMRKSEKINHAFKNILARVKRAELIYKIEMRATQEPNWWFGCLYYFIKKYLP